MFLARRALVTTESNLLGILLFRAVTNSAPSVVAPSLCNVASTDYCPAHHTSDSRCCDSHDRNLCLWDSAIQFNTKYPYSLFSVVTVRASGGIITDTLTMGSSSVTTHIVDVLFPLSSPFTLAIPNGLHSPERTWESSASAR